LDSTQDTIASTPIESISHINIEKLKTKPKLRPKDFPTRKEAYAYLQERLDSVLEEIKELEGDMIFLGENASPSEVKSIASKWEQIAQEVSTK